MGMLQIRLCVAWPGLAWRGLAWPGCDTKHVLEAPNFRYQRFRCDKTFGLVFR